MQVALDVTARIAGSTGVARYATELDAALLRRGVEVRRYAFGRALHAPPPECRHIAVPLRMLHFAWTHADVPRLDLLLPRADVVHTLDLVVPPLRRPSVATVHDLAALDRPDLHERRVVATQRRQLASLRRAEVVIVNSRATAEVLARHGVHGGRVVVTPFGRAALPSSSPAVFAGFDQYVLCVGRLERRKGQDVLIRSFNDARLNDAGLVFAGPDGPGAEAIRVMSDRSPARARVRFEGSVSDDRLASLYAGASVFALASRAEGFGLPLLEAMGAGVPVVCSDIEALAELTGDAAVRFPVDDQAALTDILAGLLNDHQRRQAMTTAGRARAAAFTWEACASETLMAYERVAG